MMYFYLLLSTAQAFPMVDVTGCRETEATRKFDESIDKVMKNLEGLFKITNFDKIMPDAGKISIRKMIYDLGDHARPLLFERVECKDGPGPDDFKPCKEVYNSVTVCEMVALRKVEVREAEAVRQLDRVAKGVKGVMDYFFEKKSTCKEIERLDATAVSVVTRGGVAMTCNMEDSIESMDLYVEGIYYKTPECPEGLQLEDPSMKDAVYDEKIFKLYTGLRGWSPYEDVTDKVKCIRKPRIVTAQEVKDDLAFWLDVASNSAPAPYNDHAQKLEDALKKMTPQKILVHYDELMADPVTKTAEIMTSQIAMNIMKDLGKTTIDLAKDKVKNKANEALDLVEGLEVVQQNQDLKDLVEIGKNNIDVVEKASNWLKGWF